MRMAITPFGAVACLFLHAAGCGDASPTGSTTTGAGGGGTATSTGVGGGTAATTGAGGGSAATTGAGGGAACVAATGTCGAPDQCGPMVPIVQVMEDMPTGLGGVLEDGTYWLTSASTYSGVGSPPQNLETSFGGTYVFAAGKFQSISVRVKTPGASPEVHESGGSFSTSTNQLTLDATCGNPGGAASTATYTVSGKTLSIYSVMDGVAYTLTGQ